jgi:hypothetical protein
MDIRVSSTNGLLKLFVVEMVVLIMAIYMTYVGTSTNTISTTAGLIIIAFVSLADMVVDYYFIDYSQINILKETSHRGS